jgi:hypothetical protein
MSTSFKKQAQSDPEASLPAEIAEVAREVVLLRSELIKIGLLEYVEKSLNPIIRKWIVTAIVGLGVLFILIAIALGLGDALGHVGWGLLVVGVGVATIGGMFSLARPKLIELGDKTAEIDTKLVEPYTHRRSLTARSNQPAMAMARAGKHTGRTLTKTELKREIETKEQLLESDLHELTDEARGRIRRYVKVIVPLGLAALSLVVGVVAWKWSGSREPARKLAKPWR